MPAAASISINGGAASTTTTNVTLVLNATDAHALQMYVTNVSGCGSGGNWEAYSSSKTWTLGQTDSTATVYVRFRDAVQNFSGCVNDSITHNSAVAPTATSISINAGAATTTTPSVTLALGATGATEMFVTNDPTCNSGGAWQAYAGSLAWVLARNGTSTSNVYVKYRSASLTESSCISDAIAVAPASLIVNGSFESAIGSEWTLTIGGKWALSTTAPLHAGSRYYRSQSVANSSEACVSQTVTGLSTTTDYTLSYAMMYGTEASWDFAKFYLNPPSTALQSLSGLSGGWVVRTQSIPKGASSHVFRWCHSKDGSGVANGDFVGVDDVSLVPAGLDPPLTFTATPTNGSVSLAITTGPTTATGHLLIRSLSPITFVPTNGVNYSTGAQGADSIIYKGTAFPYANAGTNKTLYYYAIYAYDSSNNYSTGLTTSAIPSSVYAPTSLSAVPSDQRLTLSWGAPAGTSGTGYLLVKNQGSAVTFNPQNGTSYSTGSYTGGTVVYKGTALTYADTPLTNQVMYHYKIWAYDGTNYYSATAPTVNREPTTCEGTIISGKCWIFSNNSTTCLATCSSKGLTFDATEMQTRIRGAANPRQACYDVLAAIGVELYGSAMGFESNTSSFACLYSTGDGLYAGTTSYTAPNTGNFSWGERQACPCSP